jgi:tubby-related protein 1
MDVSEITEVMDFTDEGDNKTQGHSRRVAFAESKSDSKEGSDDECDGENGEQVADLESGVSGNAPNNIPKELPDALTTVPLRKMTHCLLVRRRGPTNYFSPLYELYLQGPTPRENVKLLVAQRKMGSKVANYHIFDISKGMVSSKLSKKSGNYIGKLKASPVGPHFTILGKSERNEKLEMGMIEFQPHNIIKSLLSKAVPRQVNIILPPIKDDRPLPNRIASSSSRTIQQRSEENDKTLLRFHNKLPEDDHGIFRLNFKGRVKTPSVKNFQLTHIDSSEEVVLQFGKVNSDSFHLDFQGPFTPLQAFAVALAQFNNV